MRAWARALVSSERTGGVDDAPRRRMLARVANLASRRAARESGLFRRHAVALARSDRWSR
jgi:hypothetical protein